MKIITSLCALLLALTLAACGASENDNSNGGQPESAPIEVDAKPVANITLDGVAEELEVQPVMCGLNKSGDGFTIMAGPNDGDDNPRNNKATLSIGGKKTNLRNGSLTSIRYRPNAPGAQEENVILRGADQPWINNDQFQWSGKTQSGKSLEITISCP